MATDSTHAPPALNFERKTPLWEALKNAPSAMPKGLFTGAIVGLGVAGSVMLLNALAGGVGIEIFSKAFSTLIGENALLFATESAALHGAGHAMFEGYLDGKEAHGKAEKHNTMLGKLKDEMQQFQQTLETHLPEHALEATGDNTPELPPHVANILAQKDASLQKTWTEFVQSETPQAGHRYIH